MNPYKRFSRHSKYPFPWYPSSGWQFHVLTRPIQSNTLKKGNQLQFEEAIDETIAEEVVMQNSKHEIDTLGYYGIESITTLEELRTLHVPESMFLVDSLVVSEALNLIAGEGGTGKSSLLSQLSMSICCNCNDFLGYKIHAIHNRVIYVSTEDSIRHLKIRTDMQTSIFQYKREWFCNMGFIDQRFNAIKELEKTLHRLPADLVIIDNFGDLYEGDPNNGIEVRKFFNKLHDLIIRYKCTLLIIAHFNKSKKVGPKDKTDILGSIAMSDKARHVLILSKSSKDELRTLRIDKSNYLPEAKQKQPIYLEYKTESLTYQKVEGYVSEDEAQENDATGRKATYVVKPTRKTRKRKNREWDKRRAYEMVVEEGKTQREAAKEFGVDVSSICRWIKELRGR